MSARRTSCLAPAVVAVTLHVVLVLTARAAFACAGGGAPAAGSASVTVKCARFAGDVEFKVEAAGKDLLVTVTYPKPVASYLGGFEDGAKKVSSNVKVYLDADANPKTGMTGGDFEPGAGGAEFAIGSSEVQTTLGRDAAGASVSGPKLLVDLSKVDGDAVELPEGVYLEWEMESGAGFKPIDWVKPPDGKSIGVKVPIAALGLEPGAKTFMTGVVPICNDAFPFPGKASSTLLVR